MYKKRDTRSLPVKHNYTKVKMIRKQKDQRLDYISGRGFKMSKRNSKNIKGKDMVVKDN